MRIRELGKLPRSTFRKDTTLFLKILLESLMTRDMSWEIIFLTLEITHSSLLLSIIAYYNSTFC